MKNKKAGREPGAARVIKKYPNRRLYDTLASTYITLADIKQRVLAREPFEVRDARTGEDITRSILLQIILEDESRGSPMLSIEGLTSLIRFRGHAIQDEMGHCLDRSIRLLQEVQDRMAAPASVPTAESWSHWGSAQSPLLHGLVGAVPARDIPVVKAG